MIILRVLGYYEMLPRRLRHSSVPYSQYVIGFRRLRFETSTNIENVIQYLFNRVSILHPGYNYELVASDEMSNFTSPQQNLGGTAQLDILNRPTRNCQPRQWE